MALLGFCIYGLIHIEFGLELQDLAPRYSYLRAFDIQLRRYFKTYDPPVEIFFPTAETPWWSDGYLKMVDDLQKDLISKKIKKKKTIKNHPNI